MHRSRVILCALLGALIAAVLVPAAALGISRDTVLARGSVWVAKNVPYSQSRYARVDGSLVPTTGLSAWKQSRRGYRTDCSGFVSMCLGITNGGYPNSYSTSTFDRVLTAITKTELLPGDVILRQGHVLLFVRWVDASRRAFISYEERGTAYGTVWTTRTYADMVSWGYRPYRYNRIDDFYPDCQQTVYGSNRYDTAVAASWLTFPATTTATPKALVVTNGESWTGNLGGAALAGAGGGPLLLTTKAALPTTAAATIRRLDPEKVFVIGGPSMVATAVTDRISSLGVRVVRITGSSRYALAGRAAYSAVALARAEGRTVDAAYLVASDAFGDGVAVSPIAAKTARPILLTGRTSVPAATLDAIRKAGIERVYVLGGTDLIANSVVTHLRQHGLRVGRISGESRWATALAIAHHGAGIPGAGLTWNELGIASATRLDGMLACGVAQGQAGSLLLLTPGSTLYSGAATEIAEQRTAIGKVRIFGDYNAIGTTVRVSIHRLMRAM